MLLVVAILMLTMAISGGTGLAAHPDHEDIFLPLLPAAVCDEFDDTGEHFADLLPDQLPLNCPQNIP